MKIAAAGVSLASAHALHEEQSREESLRFWVGNERPVFDGEEELPASRVLISPEARQHAQAMSQSLLAGDGVEAAPADASPPEDPKLTAMRLILEALTGRKIRITSFAPLSPEDPGTPQQGASPEKTPAARQGWGLEYDLVETTTEQEYLDFSAGGQVVTVDGQVIDFQLQLAMSREFTATHNVRIRGGDALLIDPLVINFNGRAAAFSDMRFAFDLDGDGTSEQISGLAPGNGFLAFDRNGDGRINNGLELFGPASGNGFAELARLDSDNNGWLDENDPLYGQLRVWMREEGGNESLAPLAQKNVGAILLRPVETPFALKNSANGLQGQLRETSIFLEENGGAGMVQEIDFVV